MVYKKFNAPQLYLALLTAAGIFLFYFLFNFNYLSDWIDEKGDCLTYDYYVRLGVEYPGDKEVYGFLFNPHHIGFDWVGQEMYKMLAELGYEGSVMRVLQIRNLLFSSLGLGLMFFFFFRFSKKYLLSLSLTGIIAFCCAYWMYSQINDTPIIHSIMVFLLFFGVIYFPVVKRKVLYAVFLGCFHGINIFFHQSDALMMIIVFFVIVFYPFFYKHGGNGPGDVPEEPGPSDSPEFRVNKGSLIQDKFFFPLKNLGYFCVYFVVFTLIVTVAYYYVGVVLIGLTLDKSQAADFNMIEDSTYFFNWLILYTRIDYWGKGFEETNTFQQAVTGISTYFYQPSVFGEQKLGFDYGNFFAVHGILPNSIGLLFFSVIAGTLIFIKGLIKKYKYVFVANLLFLVIYTVFSCWWEPDYREFWVSTMFAFWILAFLVINYTLDRLKNIKPVPQIFVYSYLFLFGILLFYFNFTGFIYPNASKEFRQFDIMQSVSADEENSG